jgi:hypothetical protein
MRKRQFNSRLLRELAEELIERIAQEEDIPEREREDLVTSLVRQWITYEGHATLFVGEQQVYLVLGKTPLGKPCLVPEPALPGWMNRLREDWKISPDDLPDILDQLNRGQSAEVINGDGVPFALATRPSRCSSASGAAFRPKKPNNSSRFGIPSEKCEPWIPHQKHSRTARGKKYKDCGDKGYTVKCFL